MNKNWINLEYKLDNPSTITKELLSSNLNKFWKEIMIKLTENQHVLLIFRVRFDNNQVKTISTLKMINKTSKEELLEYLFDRLNLSNEAYSVTPLTSNIFSSSIREGNIKPDFVTENKEIKTQIFYNNKLPIATLPEEYGKILKKKG
jgi:hypothetical protein